MVSQTAAPRYIESASDAGRTYRVISDIVTILATGEETGGAYTLFETRTLPGQGTPPHFQKHEDESFYILEGNYAFQIGDESVVLGPGGYAFVPRGTVHAFRNTGDGLARMLVSTTPGGYHENFFAEAGDPVADPASPGPPAGPPDFERLMAAAKRWGVEVLPPPAE